MGKTFVGERRLIAAIISAVAVYLIVQLLGGYLGIAEGLKPSEIKLIILSTVVGAAVSKWVHDVMIPGRTKRLNI